MTLRPLRDFFTPVRLAEEPGFRAEIQQHWRRGLLLIAGVELIIPTVLTVVRLVLPQATANHVPPWASLAMIVIGLAALAAARLPGQWLLPAATAAGLATTALLSYLDFRSPEGAVYASADTLTVLLIALAALPSSFWFMLGFSASAWAVHGYIGMAAGLLQQTAFVQMVISSLVCAVLAGINFRRMLDTHRAHRATLAAELQQAQSESAASMARIAAALSHELNNPLGALKSSVQSMVTAGNKMAEHADPRLLELQRELARVAIDASGRLEDIIGRMQRFTNLDRAEVQRVDVGRVLQDVLGLCMHKKQVRLEIGDVPCVVAQPQVLSAAFAELLQKATEGDAEVAISVEARDSGVQVDVRTSASLEAGFDVRGGRVAAVNTSLLHIRNLLRSQGGDVTQGAGHIVVILPLQQAKAAAG